MILVVTEHAFLQVMPRLKVDEWVLIKDEASEPIRVIRKRCTDSFGIVGSWLNFTPLQSDTTLAYAHINANCPKTTDLNDDVLNVIEELKRNLDHKDAEVLVQYKRLSEESLLIYSVYTKPSLYRDFHQVYFLGAWFEKTFLYNIWSKNGVKWTDKTPSSLKHKVIDSARVELHYFFENGGWSKKRRTHNSDLINYCDYVDDFFNGETYLYAANSDLEPYLNSKFVHGTRIPSQSHGLNDWRNYTNIATIGSYLTNGDENSFYRNYSSDVGLTKLLRQSPMFLQQITRTDLRNYDSNFKIRVLVPTKSIALDLLNFLPNATIFDCDKKQNGQKTGINGKLNTTYKDIFDENNLSFQHGYTVANHITVINPKRILSDHSNQIIKRRTEADIVTFEDLDGLQSRIVSFSGDKVGKHPFISYLEVNQFKIPDELKRSDIDEIKRQISVYSSARFTGTSFGKDDAIENSDLLVFDFDESTLSIRDLSFIFKGLTLFWYTTLRNLDEDEPTNDKATRFRVLLPCSRSVSLSEHGTIMRYWQNKLENYCTVNSKISGFDKGSLQAFRKYFFPHLGCKFGHLIKEKAWLDVDRLLYAIRREIIVKGCGNFLEYENFRKPSSEVHEIYVHEIEKILASFSKGYRSIPAVVIGGKLRKYPIEVREHYLKIIQNSYADEKACANARKYAYG
jgi:hypothetical protein